MRLRGSGRRRMVVLASACALVAGGLVTAVPAPVHAQTACSVTYQGSWDSGGGFGADITIENVGAPITGGWTLTFTFPGNQQIGQGWAFDWSQSGADVAATNLSWNATIPTGGQLTGGFNGSYSGTNPEPTAFFLNGTACDGSAPPPPPPPTTSPPPTGGEPVFESCDQWGMWQTGPWTLYNNIWGSGAGSQCIWADSPTNWGVVADHPNTGGVKSYPNLTQWYGQRISQMGPATTSFDVSVPTSNVAFASTYDIWSDDNAHEIMLWMNWYGPVGPIGGYVTTVTVGGHTWDLYRGGHSGIEVYSLLRQGNTHTGTIDIAAVTDWLLDIGEIPDVVIGDVQFGFEITSASGGRDFVVNDYSVTLN